MHKLSDTMSDVSCAISRASKGKAIYTLPSYLFFLLDFDFFFQAWLLHLPCCK